MRRTRRSARRSRNYTKHLVVVLMVCVGFSVVQQKASAWGRLGHRVASKIAFDRLNPTAKRAIEAILKPGESLADASTWADEQRRAMPETGPWHYVNVPVSEPGYSEKYCPADGCVVTQVDVFRKQLVDPSLDAASRQKALRFLVHFVEDMHQPLHVGDNKDRGGNDHQVQFFSQGTNMHRLWDSDMIEHDFHDEATLHAEIEKRASVPASKDWKKGSTEDWANESHAAAKIAYTDPKNQTFLKKGAKLGEAYQASNRDVALDRVAQAGVRLADILNNAFPEPSAR